MAQQCVIKPMLEVELYDNNDGNVETDWKEWKKKHAKCYGPEEDGRRKQAWLKTRVTVTEHNRLYMAGKVTSTQGVNHFAADLEGEGPAMGLIMPSEEEMKRLEAEQNLAMAQQCVIKPMLEVELYDNNDGNVETDWKEWKKKHAKCYGPEEDGRRKQAWLKTRVTVTEHNRLYMAGKVTSTQGVNHFAADLEGEGPPMGLIMPFEEINCLKAEHHLAMAQQCVIKPMLEVELYDNNDGNVETDWKEWKKKHGKCYGPEEDGRRKQAWLKTRVTVTEHNRLYMAGKVTSTQGVNHFAADLEGEGPAMGLIMPSEEEMKRLEAEQNLVGFL